MLYPFYLYIFLALRYFDELDYLSLAKSFFSAFQKFNHLRSNFIMSYSFAVFFPTQLVSPLSFSLWYFLLFVIVYDFVFNLKYFVHYFLTVTKPYVCNKIYKTLNTVYLIWCNPNYPKCDRLLLPHPRNYQRLGASD